MSKNSKTLTEKEIRRLMNSVGGKNSAMSKKGGGFSMGGYSKGGSQPRGCKVLRGDAA